MSEIIVNGLNYMLSLSIYTTNFKACTNRFNLHTDHETHFLLEETMKRA